MRCLASIFLFLLAAGSLPVTAAGAGGDGHDMIRLHFENQQTVALAAGDSRLKEAGRHYLRQQNVVTAKRNSGLKAAGLHQAIQQRTALAIKDSELKQKLKTLAAEKVQAECESCKIAIECKWIAPLVSKSKPEIISGLYFDKPGMPAGYATAKVAFNDAAPSVNATVQFYVSVRQKVPVATADIESGAPVSEADFTWQWKDVSRLNRKPVTSGDYFNDKTAARMIREGRIFYPSDLLGAMSIRPGDRVTMQYGGEGVQLKIACIAREAKGMGQKVRLYSKETGRRYLAKIISKNEIIWVKTL